MLEFLQAEEQLYYECEEADGVAPHQVMCVSTAATGSEASEQTLQIVMEIQGHTLSVLIDSGNTHSFLNMELLPKLHGVSTIKPTPVKIANGDLVFCNSQWLLLLGQPMAILFPLVSVSCHWVLMTLLLAWTGWYNIVQWRWTGLKSG
jgi:hypothetical protein